jgi:hypothetical protein
MYYFSLQIKMGFKKQKQKNLFTPLATNFHFLKCSGQYLQYSQPVIFGLHSSVSFVSSNTLPLFS